MRAGTFLFLASAAHVIAGGLQIIRQPITVFVTLIKFGFREFHVHDCGSGGPSVSYKWAHRSSACIVQSVKEPAVHNKLQTSHQIEFISLQKQNLIKQKKRVSTSLFCC